MSELCQGSELKKSLDPSGFLRAKGVAEDEALEMVKDWEAAGLPLHMMQETLEHMEKDPALEQEVIEELDKAEEEVSRISEDALPSTIEEAMEAQFKPVTVVEEEEQGSNLKQKQ